MRNILKYIPAVILLFGLTSCDYFDLEDPQPVNSISPDLAFANRQAAQAAVAGAYDELQDPDIVFDGYHSFWQLHSDETVFTGTFPTRQEFGNMSVFPSNTTAALVFTEFYDAINVCNNIIEILPAATDVTLETAGVKESFIAEARFIRALSYLHLTLGWGDVPLITKPTVSVGEELNVTVAPQAAVYDQIIADFQYAAANLNVATSLGATPDAANGFLARIALYQGRWADAYSLATGVLGAGFDLTTFPFLTDEIFFLKFISTDGNSLAFFYGTAAQSGRHSIEPSPKLLNDTYEDGDLRIDATFGYDAGGVPFGNKYNDFNAAGGTQTDPVLFMRHAELVLIAAEAAARTGDFTNANAWFNQVRARAGVAAVTLAAGNFEDAILLERQRELAMESGHRLWDLRRTGKALEVLGPLGYDACDNVWGLPQRDIDRNPNLVQNDCCNC